MEQKMLWSLLLTSTFLASSTEMSKKPCSELLIGQFVCERRNSATNSIYEDPCHVSNKDKGEYVSEQHCYPAPGIVCDGKIFDGDTIGFTQTTPCKSRSEKSFKTALLLSIFLGMFGIDRFYLGYPALGLLKLSTFGFMLVGHLVDIILIAAQVVKPADGGEYIMDYFGAQLEPSMWNVSYPVP